ncbi:MAG: hypothetical protein CVU39_15240 [Chloroflexi bacterium HGW-Chloroflexi-10]|nr:MAG: hypothetical protein CVU39_15240 [Chloroflexi bacterium HGW-Chloroflexi-10]
MNNELIVEWLFVNSGPILRYRIAVDLMEVSNRKKERLFQESLATPEAQRWISNLNKAQNIHGSKDTDAENPLAKLLEYGFNRAHPAFDKKVKDLLNTTLQAWDHFVLLPYLLRAGYADHPTISEWLKRRIDTLYNTAQLGSFDFYLNPAETKDLPKAWQGKPIYRDEFGHQAGYALPTCYDFYALAYCSGIPGIIDLPSKCETIVSFLSDPRFQATIGGYGWDRNKKRCYAAGRVFLACVEPARLVLFLNLGAGFHAARKAQWFHQGIAALESYRTSRDTFCFPSNLLIERTGNHMYGGSHMGLGENRRSPQALELESTFHMLTIQKRLKN